MADTNAEIAVFSAPASTNGLCFAAYHSEAGQITLEARAVVTVLSGEQVWIGLEEPKSGKDPSKAYLTIKDILTAQCTQLFGKRVEIFGVDTDRE